MRLLLSNFLHAAAHRLTPRQWPCECEVRAYTRGWTARRNAELRERVLPATPDELDIAFRELMRRSEEWPAA